MGETEEVQKEKQACARPSMETSGASQPTKVDKNIHEWFVALSLEEQARALSFEDDNIFAIIIKHALFAEAIQDSKTEKKDDSATNPLHRFGWHAEVSISDFEASIPTIATSDETETIEKDVTTTSSESTKAYKVEPQIASNYSTAATETKSTPERNEETGETQLSDAYRIRVGEEKSPLSNQENGDDAVSSSSSPLQSISSIEPHTDIAEMMNNICVIFSANKLNLSDSANHACITLKPSYLGVQNGAGVLSALEGILSHAIPKNSHFASPLESSLESLRNSVFDSANQEKTSIPLYAVVVLRMMSAIVESYRQLTTTECSDASDATVLAEDRTDNSVIKTGGGQLALSSTGSEYLLQLCSLPETEEALLLDLSDVSCAAEDCKILSNEGVGLILPLRVLLQEMKSSVSKDSALSANDSVKAIVQKYIQDGSRGKSHHRSSSQATSASRPDTDVNDTPIVSSQRETKSIPEPVDANEQVSRPTGKKKKRKKKKRKGTSGQGQNGQGQNPGGKLQSSMTQQQEAVLNQPARDERIDEREATSALDSLEGRDREEDDKQKSLDKGKTESSTAPTTHESRTRSAETETVENVSPASELSSEDQQIPVDVCSDSEDDEKTESQDKNEAKKPTQESTMDDSKNVGQNMVAGLSTIADIENDDSGEWETVEVKGRGNRKKAAERASQNRFQSHQPGQSNSGQNSTSSKKSKASRNSIRKQRANMRKMVREILSTVLDRVEEKVQKRHQVRRETANSAVNFGLVTAPVRGNGTMNGSRERPKSQMTNESKDLSMRDIVSHKEDSAQKGSRSPVRNAGNRMRQRDGRSGQGQIRRGADGFIYRDKTNATGTGADQNTAPTVQETLSAVSVETSARQVTAGAEVLQGDISSGDSGQTSKSQSSQNGKEVSPPLPTLLSPENANSASSSVASSLDTSHAGHQNNHIASQQRKEKDVGYHLLDVCDRLTRDINIFMKRREHALEARRRERGAVLMALQGTVSSIWPNLCNVEMYGSCATQLDLPSSDLDAVVTGLYKPPREAPQSNGNAQKMSEGSHSPTEPKSDGGSSESVSGGNCSNDPVNNHNAAQHAGHPHPGYSQLSQNAERIVRLAVELEREPWAVHVKAIPTASVPVIKILADPTRISGNGEWLMQEPSAVEASAVSSNERGMIDQGQSKSSAQTPSPPFQSQQALPWRGADVMNGLLKVDITFEGPEHGGIGSTKFSSRVVKEFCDETGLQQDGTPAVQVLMVVKELLAQRRLNEPFSGGLSSYALLLLVISVLRERAIICQELERAERQRQLVASEDVEQRKSLLPANQAKLSAEKASATKKAAQPTPRKTTNKPSWNVAARGGASSSDAPKNVQTQPVPKKVNVAPPAKAGSSSWASIAMKSSSQSNGVKANKDGSEKSNSDKMSGRQGKTVRKASSFADAVANGRRAPKQTDGKAGLASQPRTIEALRAQDQKTKLASQVSAQESEQMSTTQSTPQSTASSLPSRPAGSAISGVQSTAQPIADEATFAEGRSMFPQGFHDVTEVLCSGETTAGKLLMHFLLFYGQHFDSQSTAIDYSGTHKRDAEGNNGYSQVSPYMRRRSGGSYDPMTGMLTVDPIVVYDPLEGAETSNVARSCFAWSSIRWVFAQSYLTLLSTVEINQNHGAGQSGNTHGISRSEGKTTCKSQNENELAHPWNGPYGHDKSGNMMIDALSPLLELLLSF